MLGLLTAADGLTDGDEDSFNGAVEEDGVALEVEGARVEVAGGIPGVDAGLAQGEKQADALARADGLAGGFHLPDGAGGG